MAKIGIVKSVPENNYLKTCPTRLPGARSASLHPELPRGVQGQQLQQHRVQSPWFCSGTGKCSLQLFAITNLQVPIYS